MKKVLPFLIVLLFMGIVTIIGMIASHLRSPNQKLPSTVTKASEAIEKNSPQHSPPYAPGWIKWEIALTTDPQSITSIEKNMFLYTREGNPIANLTFAGNEWVGLQTYSTNEDYLKAEKIVPYYLKKLFEHGWNYSLEIDEGKVVKGVAADGPLGQVLAYIRQNGSTVTVFVLASQTDTTECPCTVINRVFVSDPIPISTVLENYDKL